MFSIKGIGFKIFAAIIAAIALAAGIWMTFFQSSGFETATATIISIENDPDYVPAPIPRATSGVLSPSDTRSRTRNIPVCWILTARLIM